MTTPIEKFDGGAILDAEEVAEVKRELDALRGDNEFLQRKIVDLNIEIYELQRQLRSRPPPATWTSNKFTLS